MIELTATEIAEAVGGTLSPTANPDTVVRHAVTDSREVTGDTLFIAKPGETTDGHRFISAARQAGATLILAQRPSEDDHGRPDPAVIVDDVVTAMGLLAAEIIRRIRAHSETTVIGITGSVGKTTAKDALAKILSSQGPTVAPQGSYNGEVGVPLTVFTAELDTRYLVVEMGADRVGNITELCQMVQPDIGVVLTVGSAHTASFGSVENIIKTKGELVEGLRAGGTAVLNVNDSSVVSMASRVPAEVNTVWFSSTDEALEDFTPCIQGYQSATTENENPQFTLRAVGFADASDADRQGYPVTAALIGEHHTQNILAAAAAAHAAGVALDDIAAALQNIGPASAHRMARTERADGITIIDDAYNANPESMRAGLRTLAMLGRNTGRRTWAVLGEMLELGDTHSKEHILVGESVVRLNISQLVVVGKNARALYTGAVMEGSWGDETDHVHTIDEAYDLLQEQLAPGDIVFVKGSNSTGMWKLADRLIGAEAVEVASR